MAPFGQPPGLVGSPDVKTNPILRHPCVHHLRPLASGFVSPTDLVLEIVLA